jgi:hypothetical protein
MHKAILHSLFFLSLATAIGCGGNVATTAPAPAPIAPPVSDEPIPPTSAAVSVTGGFVLAVANSDGESLVRADVEVYPANPGCSSTVAGGCLAETCTSAPLISTLLDVGVLNVKSSPFGASAVTIPANGSPVYVGKGWPTGDDVEVIGTGGADVPAFDVHGTIPPMLSGLKFDGCTGATTSIACSLASTGSQLTWNPQPGVLVEIHLEDNLDVASKSLTCTFRGELGRGHIPAEAIATLAPAAPYTAYTTTRMAPPMVIAGSKLPFRVDVARQIASLEANLTTP